MDKEPLDSLLKFGATTEGKIRLIQETVPGKQVTLAHIIANPDEIIYKKLGLDPNLDYAQAAIGICCLCPSETAVIARRCPQDLQGRDGLHRPVQRYADLYRAHLQRAVGHAGHHQLFAEQAGLYRV